MIMKTTATTLILLLTSVCLAQENKYLDTIFANDFTNTALFFPSQIRQGTVGAENYIFSFNETQAQYLGLLKALPGKESNLLVLTEDGSIYSYILSYKTTLPKLNYFIQKEERIGNEVPTPDSLSAIAEVLKKDTVIVDSLAKGHNDLKNLADYYLKIVDGNLKTKRRGGLKIRAEDLIYYKDLVFMVLEFENSSKINFEIEYFNIYLTRGNRKRNASFQKLLIEPVYKHGFPVNVFYEQKSRFVVVLPKFTVGENEKIEIELREKKGNRFLRMGFRP